MGTRSEGSIEGSSTGGLSDHTADSSRFERLFREVARASKPDIHARLGSARARPTEVIGPYRILGLLGRGGMGVVYRGEHLQSGQLAAIKTVRVPEEGLLAGIRREIHVLARLRHPGVVRIIEEGLHEGLPWYAMELLEGATLSQWRGSGAAPPDGTKTWWTASLLTLPDDEACRAAPGRGAGSAAPGRGAGSAPLGSILNLVRRICEPLAFLHGEGIVHRDLKPENILVLAKEQVPGDVGQPVLMDFGLVTQFGGEVSREELEVGGTSAGTIVYMAPEQIRGELVDARADLYSLGCIVFELVTGRPPFVGPTPRAILQKHLDMEPVPPSRFAHEVGLVVPAELDALVLRLLSKRPQDRVGYADDVASKLIALGAEDNRNAQAPRARSYLYRPGFAGREDILPQLVSKLDRLVSGDGLVLATGHSVQAQTSGSNRPVPSGIDELVLVGGESGVGKTRLATELARRAEVRGIRVLAGECLPLGAPQPGGTQGGTSLQALRPVLRAIADRCRQRGPIEVARLFGRRRSVLAQYEPTLSQIPGVEPEPEPEELPAAAARIRLFSDLAETFAAFGEVQPLLLILDDLQWADELTLGFLEFLLRSGHLARSRMLVLGTYRTEELGGTLQSLCESSAGTRLDLERLDAEAVLAMAGDMLALSPAPLGLSRFLSVQSEGNPFFVAEYLRLAVEERLLFRDDDGRWQAGEAGEATDAAFESLPLPRSLQELVGRRLDGLPREAVTLTAAAAVVGRDVPVRLLGPMTRLSDEERMRALAELLRRQVLEEPEPGVFRFVHDKIREVRYAQLEALERRQLHRAAAEVIETVYSEQRADFLGTLGHHWEQAGESERSRDFYLQGAQLALGRSSFEEAVQLARHGTRLGGGAKARLMLIEALIGLSNYSDVLREAREATQLPDASDEERLRAERHIAHVLMEKGDDSALMLQAEEVLRLSSDNGTRADGLYFRATALRRSGRCDEALAQHAEALAIAGEVERVAMAHLDSMAIAYIELGAQEKAIACDEEALAIAHKIGYRRGAALILNNLSVAHYQHGDYEPARSCMEESLEINRRIGHRFGVALNLNQLGILHDDRGAYEQAIAVYKEALAINSAIGSQVGVSMNLANIGCAHYFRGEVEDGIAALEQSLSIARVLMMPREISSELEYLGLCYVALGRFTEAEQALGEGIETTQTHNLKYSLASSLLARARARLGRPGLDGRGDAERSLELWHEMGNRFREGAALATLARYDSLDGSHVEASRKIESARALVPEGKDFNLYLQRLEDESVVRAAASDRAGALAIARDAARLARSHGALTALRRIEQVLSALEPQRAPER